LLDEIMHNHVLWPNLESMSQSWSTHTVEWCCH